MKFISGVLSAIAGVMTVIVLDAQIALALSASQVAGIAEQISVRVDGQSPGSGVLLAKQGQTYYVLTAAHVIGSEDEYEVVTPDNQRYPLAYSQVKKLPGVDLAVAQFESSKTYNLAELGDSSQSKRGMNAYVAGWPVEGPAINQSTLLFQQGIISASSQVQQADGYGLIYTNNTLPGMSGGPVLSDSGVLIGIHGRGEIDRQEQTRNPDIVVKVGYNLGIPINTFLALAPKTGLNLGLRTASTPSAPSSNSSSRIDDWIAEGSQKLYQGEYDEALILLNRVINTDPTVAAAYRLRADAQMSGLGWSFLEGRSPNNRETVVAAQKDIDAAIRLNPSLSDAYTIRGYLRFVQRDTSGAIADIDQALQLDPQKAMPYILRSNVMIEKGNKQKAIADANQALALEPNSPYAAFAYSSRGIAVANSGDLSGGLLDLSRSIKLAPGNSFFYMNRGTLLAKMGDFQSGMTDLEKGASLAIEKGHTTVHQEILKIMKVVRQRSQ